MLTCTDVAWVLPIVSVVKILHIGSEDFLTESVKLALGLMLVVLDAVTVRVDDVPLRLCIARVFPIRFILTP